ncbi:MAG: HAMP domain-containing histidine kinase [Saprospiraceae bacterium]|nr:HAMP domain-containing histidine kinase [Saprospiraceae bacterium]
MSSGQKKRLRWLTHAVFAYLVLAILWWGILLLRTNKESFASLEALQRLEHQQNQANGIAYEQSLPYRELQTRAKRQDLMIYGEAAVFILALFAGLWFINRGYLRELEATAQKRNFLLAITHELKSPLASIKLILQSLQRNAFSQEQRTKMLEDGGQEVDRLNSLVNNILLAARLDKSYHPHFEQLSLQKIVTPILQSLSIPYPQVRIRLLGDMDVVGFFDRDGMTTLLHNLLDNAIKYSGEESEVILSVNKNDDFLYIKVMDQGPGIAKDEKLKIFEQFYRAGNEDQRSTKGTGLGLYLVKKIVEVHGGSIVVEDNKPKGTTFVVKLKYR